MFKWSAFPFIRISLCLISGILLYDQLPQFWQYYELWLATGTSLLFFVWFFWRYNLFFGALTLVFISYLGGSLAYLNDESRAPDHYSHQSRVNAFVGTIVSDHTEKENYFRYDLKVHAGMNDSSSFLLSGKLYLYIKKKETDTTSSLLNYGDVVAVSGNYFPVAAPTNPHEFDYRNYLKRQNIFAHAFVPAEAIRKIDYVPESRIRAFAYQIRGYAQRQLDAFISYERERAILTALLLGIKDHLDNDLKSAYAAAGAMHVLAVSGLHVGIIYLVLVFLFKHIREKRWGMLLFVLVSIAIIWMYALVTGFSPSVMRAATMFTVIIVSDAFNRKANIYNSLGVAACILIVYDTNMIWSVGFQLSFAAVFGIVKLYPKLYRSFEINNRMGDYFWSITCVSIAAQLATFPLTLLYFHQLPTYFLVSNLVVIPAATLMLGVGIMLLMAGSILPSLGETVGFYFQKVVWLINEAVKLVKDLPQPVFDWLYFDRLDTVLVYLFMVFLIIGLYKFSFPNVCLSAIFIILMFSWLHFKAFHQYKNDRIVFYEMRDILAIDLIAGKEAVLLLDSFSLEKKELLEYQVNPNRLACGLPSVDKTVQLMSESALVHHHFAYDLIRWHGQRILVVKDLSGYEIKRPIKADIIYLKNPLNFNPSILQGTKYILGSGWNYYKEEELLSAYGKQINVHSLSQDGFWELDLNETKKLADGSGALLSIQ